MTIEKSQQDEYFNLIGQLGYLEYLEYLKDKIDNKDKIDLNKEIKLVLKKLDKLNN